ncbi:MAG: transpeptidase family protein [Cyclobacteriaceae bacterium]|nr:transpeptidase family protein [Cyclobacteriaceae bacterium]
MVQTIEGPKWREKAKNITYQYKPVKATRGNIYSDNGSLLSTSLPFYKVAFDATVVDKELFLKEVDSLAYHLSVFFKDKSKSEYKNLLTDARAKRKRYVILSNKQINFRGKKELSNWPIFREGRYLGGVIFERVDRRFLPFVELGSRTVGFINENNRGAGLEFSFNQILAGTNGEAMYQKFSGGSWKPVYDGTEIKSTDGKNIKTTIDVNLQDVAESALQRALRVHEADYGLVVVMEVQTGKIKAISNLTKSGGDYHETYNYVVGSLVEPGSTIKLATMLTLLEENNIDLNDSIDTGNGVYTIYNNKVKDDHEGGWGKMTIRQAFEKSSNVAMVKLVEKYFSLDPVKFLTYFDKLNLTEPLNFQISGEGKPNVPRPSDSGWSGITLPWMAHGYGLEITPLHILTLFNAVANNGQMIRPIIVQSVLEADKEEKTYETKVLNPKICSDETLMKLKTMLEGVVNNGTASNIKGTHYKIAGKTGTTQILEKGVYTSKYITSFAGYFPADNPAYTALVLIRNPKGWRQYGSNVAAPVFKEIADNIYARDIKMHTSINVNEIKWQEGVFPVIRAGKLEELQQICNELGVSNHVIDNNEWVRTKINGNAVEWIKIQQKKNTMPDVSGMTFRDALYILENEGLKIEHRGLGRVEEQSIPPGRKIEKGNLVVLTLG